MASSDTSLRKKTIDIKMLKKGGHSMHFRGDTVNGHDFTDEVENSSFPTV